ncbi:MAG: phosphatase PAP2 family protein [Gemmatimonadota bacterium]
MIVRTDRELGWRRRSGKRACALARRVGVDLLPAAGLTLVTVLGAWLLPRFGGPGVIGTVELPLSGAGVALWLVLATLAGAILFVAERVGALHRHLRHGSTEVSPLIPAARRFAVRRGHRIAAAAGGGMLIHGFMPTFLAFKTSIPEFQPFGRWDVIFIEADRLVHGGAHPWEILHPLVGLPSLTLALDLLYYLWFPVTILGFLLVTVSIPGSDRARFLLSFSATWILLGIVMATATASVGPCYVAYIPGVDDPYEGLMAYLAGVDAESRIRALEIQGMLWLAYEEGHRGLTSGIAAMPSLHVAIPALFATAVWTRSRVVSLALWGYTFLIFIGSVHLGWHYAMDGYVSIVAVLVLWWASGRICGWSFRNSPAWGRPS